MTQMERNSRTTSAMLFFLTFPSENFNARGFPFTDLEAIWNNTTILLVLRVIDIIGLTVICIYYYTTQSLLLEVATGIWKWGWRGFACYISLIINTHDHSSWECYKIGKIDSIFYICVQNKSFSNSFPITNPWKQIFSIFSSRFQIKNIEQALVKKKLCKKPSWYKTAQWTFWHYLHTKDNLHAVRYVYHLRLILTIKRKFTRCIAIDVRC